MKCDRFCREEHCAYLVVIGSGKKKDRKPVRTIKRKSIWPPKIQLAINETSEANGS
jgi:hypothetical protein